MTNVESIKLPDNASAYQANSNSLFIQSERSRNHTRSQDKEQHKSLSKNLRTSNQKKANPNNRFELSEENLTLKNKKKEERAHLEIENVSVPGKLMIVDFVDREDLGDFTTGKKTTGMKGEEGRFEIDIACQGQDDDDEEEDPISIR